MRRTPLFEKHQEAGGRFVEFGGWEMPVQYEGIQAEHLAVRRHAGLFDVSHMGEIEIRGAGAVEAANHLFTNDLARVEDGQACYTAMCLPTGGIVDDLVVYRFAADHLLVVTNAANREKDFAWVSEHLPHAPGAAEAEAIDRGDDYAQLALQGPAAESILQKLTETPLAEIGRFRFTTGEVASRAAIIARTGYTGEDGFELYVAPEDAGPIWDALFDADPALVPVGLGARDTLRLEMKLALYGNDIDETTTPLEAGLGFVTKLDKSDFIGKEAIAAQKRDGVPCRLVAFKMDGRAIARPGYPVLGADGAQVGRVTSGTLSPSLGVPIGMAYVPTGQHRPGSKIEIQVRKRTETATIVKPPLVKPGSATS